MGAIGAAAIESIAGLVFSLISFSSHCSLGCDLGKFSSMKWENGYCVVINWGLGLFSYFFNRQPSKLTFD